MAYKPRSRLINQNITDDVEFNELPPKAALLFVMTLPHLDRDGLITGEPVQLWATVARRRVELMDYMAQAIELWVQHNLVTRYEWRHKPVLFFRAFRKYNANGKLYAADEPSQFPPPPDWMRTEQGLVPESPELSARVADGIDKRSSYYRLLMAHASRDDLTDPDPDDVPDAIRDSAPDGVPDSIPDAIAKKRREAKQREEK